MTQFRVLWSCDSVYASNTHMVRNVRIFLKILFRYIVRSIVCLSVCVCRHEKPVIRARNLTKLHWSVFKTLVPMGEEETRILGAKGMAHSTLNNTKLVKRWRGQTLQTYFHFRWLDGLFPLQCNSQLVLRLSWAVKFHFILTDPVCI